MLAIVLAGCAPMQTAASSAASQKFAQQMERIGELQQQCIEKTTVNMNATTRANFRNHKLGHGTSQPARSREEIAKCRTEADRLSEKISSQQRVDYWRQVEEERQHNSLVSILTTSRTH